MKTLSVLLLILQLFVVGRLCISMEGFVKELEKIYPSATQKENFIQAFRAKHKQTRDMSPSTAQLPFFQRVGIMMVFVNQDDEESLDRVLRDIREKKSRTLTGEKMPNELAEIGLEEFAGMSIKEDDMHEQGREIPRQKARVDEMMGYSSRRPPIDIVKPRSKSHSSTAASMTYIPDYSADHERIFPTDSDYVAEELRQRRIIALQREAERKRAAAAEAARASSSRGKKKKKSVIDV